MEKRIISNTQDGSKTLHIPAWNENYHSSHGALQEAQHVFLTNGLQRLVQKPIHIIEYGLGTGLNALLTAIYAENSKQTILYTALEKYPVTWPEIQALEIPSYVEDPQDLLGKIHRTPWQEKFPISTYFSLTKNNIDFRKYSFTYPVDLVYFDAFGHRVQPHLWSEDIFQNIYLNMNSGGLLTTYSSKGLVRRTLQNIGFEVEKLPGPKGKREMINAWKK